MNKAASRARSWRCGTRPPNLPSRHTSPRIHAASRLHSAHVRGLAAVSPGNRSERVDGLRLCLPLAAPHRKRSRVGTW